MQINEFLPPIGTDLLLSSSLQIEYPVWGQNVNMYVKIRDVKEKISDSVNKQTLSTSLRR